MSEDKPYDLSALSWALYVLTTAHTRDDDLTGFVIMRGADGRHSGFSDAEYIRAWEIMRWASGQNYKAETNE